MITIRIGIDVDNVCANSASSVISQFNAYTGENLQLSDIKSYWMENYVAPRYHELMVALWEDKNTWKRLKILPNCVEVIRRLWDDGNEIFFVTSTTSANVRKKVKWLQRQFQFLDVEKAFINIRQKQLLNIDVLIDDYELNLINAPYKGILFTYPWNENWQPPSGIVRVNGWSEVERKLWEVFENE